MNAQIMYDASQKPFGLLLVFRDVSKAREVNRAKTEFISLASHELRTPITGIMWAVKEIEKEGGLSKRAHEYVSDIHQAALRMFELTEQFLRDSRLEEGDVQLVPTEFELRDVLEQAIERYAPSAKSKQIEVEVKNTEAIAMRTDRPAVTTIVEAFLLNAIDYTHEGGHVALSAEMHDSWVRISVTDDGVGIPLADQSHIFDRFFRASNAREIKPNGVGLGLYIVARTVRALGGRAWFTSKERRGSTFLIEIPQQSHIDMKGAKRL